MPPGVITSTLTLPDAFAGIVTVILVSLLKVKHGAVGHGVRSWAPTFTSVAPVKLLPVRITSLPPSVEPDDGVRLVKVGAGVTYVYDWLPDAPPPVVTVTLTLPATCPGTLWTVICVSLSTVKHDAVPQDLRSFGPKFTSVAPVKFVPVRTTSLPPAVDPDVGLRLAKVGGGESLAARLGRRSQRSEKFLQA